MFSLQLQSTLELSDETTEREDSESQTEESIVHTIEEIERSIGREETLDDLNRPGTSAQTTANPYFSIFNFTPLKNNGKPKFDDKTILEACNKMRQGVPLSALAREYGASVKTVKSWQQMYAPELKKRKIESDKKREACSRVQQGVTIAKVSRAYEVHPSTVRAWMQKYTPEAVQESKPVKRYDTATIYEACKRMRMGESAHKIANELGAAVKTVKKWKIKFLDDLKEPTYVPGNSGAVGQLSSGSLQPGNVSMSMGRSNVDQSTSTSWISQNDCDSNCQTDKESGQELTGQMSVEVNPADVLLCVKEELDEEILAKITEKVDRLMMLWVLKKDYYEEAVTTEKMLLKVNKILTKLKALHLAPFFDQDWLAIWPLKLVKFQADFLQSLSGIDNNQKSNHD